MSEAIDKATTGGAVAVPMPDIGALQATSEYGDPQGLAKIGAIGFSFLPRLQLFTSNSEECKTGAIKIAHYGIIKGQDPVKELGKTVLIVPIAWRAKAMDVKSFDKPVAFHKPNSNEFKAIRSRADADGNSGCMYGPEFLVWVPSEGCYATFLMGSKTARNAAPPVKALLPKPGGQLRAGILEAQYIEGTEFKWHGPKIVPTEQSFEGPPAEGIMDVLTNFLNPIDSVPDNSEPAPADATSGDR